MVMGDPDIIPNHWTPVDLFWVENKNGSFVKHVVGPYGDRHGLGLGDLNGDERIDIITTEGWYMAPDNYSDGEWQWHPEYTIEVRASLPMLVHDVNSDGKNDIIYGSGHDYGVYWLENKSGSKWARHVIDESWSQAHTIVLADINSDGNLDLVTGKRLRGHRGKDAGAMDPLGLYWYEIDRKTYQFKKHILAYNTGIGTGMEINIIDIDRDRDDDIVVSGKSGLYLLENMQQFEKSIDQILQRYTR